MNIKNHIYSDEFTQYLNKLESHQRFMGFIDSCHSEAFVNMKELNTNAKVIIISATIADKIISDSIGQYKFFPWIKREGIYRTNTCVLAYIILVEELLSLDDTVEMLEHKLLTIQKDSFSWLQYIRIITNMTIEEKQNIKISEFISK